MGKKCAVLQALLELGKLLDVVHTLGLCVQAPASSLLIKLLPPPDGGFALGSWCLAPALAST